ncbi:hypothetical protein JCM21900_006629, partial [Sporobolomyces salmonicolor]
MSQHTADRPSRASPPSPTVSTPKQSDYSSLPSPPVDLGALRKRSFGAPGSSVTSAYSRMGDPSPLPFPRQTSAKLPRSPTPSPAPSLSGSPPTWPDPGSYNFSSMTKKTSTMTTHQHKSPHASFAQALKPRSLLSGKLIYFELALGDRLADSLHEDQTLRSITEASGVLSTEIKFDGVTKKLACTGSASAVNKARQLVDAKLSQTPIHNFVAVNLSLTSTNTLSFFPSPATNTPFISDLHASTYRLSQAALSPTSTPTPPAVRPSLQKRQSSGGISSRSRSSSRHRGFSAAMYPLSTAASARERESAGTPSSEHSGDSFFTAQASPAASPPTSSSFVGLTTLDAGFEDEDEVELEVEVHPPQIGSFVDRREEYLEAVVDELEWAIKRRSLIRVKLDVGSQEWFVDGERAAGAKRWTMGEIEKWQIDSASSASSPSVSPQFSTSLSRASVDRLLGRLTESSSKFDTFHKNRDSSQVHILHLDRARAMYGVAIADVRGQDLRNLPPRQSATGTLVLRKCSTLASKPFSLSLINPTSKSNPQNQATEGRDLRLKVHADKSATSPSLALSAAMQSATWEVDAFGIFRVNIELKEERFGKTETEIRWASRERWENEDASLRFTLSELRHSSTPSHHYELELCSPALNVLLAEYTLDQAQGSRGKCDRVLVRQWVERLMTLGEWAVREMNGAQEYEDEGEVSAEEEEEDEEVSDGGEHSAPTGMVAA